MTFGLAARKVIIDPAQRVVSIHRTLAWFFRRRRRIAFQRVEAVTYGYEDWSLSAPWSLARDSVDLFRVGLQLFGGEDVRLFFFYGDGTFTNDSPLPDWLFWDDYLFDVRGDQESESRAFAELLSKMIGVPVQPPNP